MECVVVLVGNLSLSRDDITLYIVLMAYATFYRYTYSQESHDILIYELVVGAYSVIQKFYIVFYGVLHVANGVYLEI